MTGSGQVPGINVLATYIAASEQIIGGYRRAWIVNISASCNLRNGSSNTGRKLGRPLYV